MAIRQRVERLLNVAPEAKPAIYGRIYESAQIASLNYWLEIVFAAGIATLGLVLNSPAVVIGAMLISPLMGPILAAGLAVAASDLYLGLRSLLSLSASIAGAIALSGLTVWLLPFHAITPEILNRTQPNVLDLGVAVFSGLAGSIVVCRGGSGGGVTALPGVSIAVALMPPLCAVGFGVGSGMDWPVIRGAGLLFLTNLVAIVASAFLVFLMVRMDAPDVREEIDESIRQSASQDRLYGLLQRTFLSKSLGDIGKLHWRVMMLGLPLVVLFVPLRRGLEQVRDETVARVAVRESIRQMAPADSLVSQAVELQPDRIRVRLTVTGAVPAARVQQAQSEIIRRTGKNVDISVRKVAGEDELALLRERLSTPAHGPLDDLDALRPELFAKLDQPLREIWPAGSAKLVDHRLAFGEAGVLAIIRYEAAEEIHGSGAETMQRFLQARLGVGALQLDLIWIRPEPPPRRQKLALRTR